MNIPKLTPGEITSLWNSYLTNTIALWVTRHFIINTQDDKLLSILKYAEEIALDLIIQPSIDYI